MAKVSICTPAYKDAAGIRRLLESVINSDFCDYDMFITDDTPDDSVALVVKEYSERIPFLKYIHNDTPLGPGKNWNKSIAEADSEYIKIMHQDDWFTFPDSLGKFVSMLDNEPDAVLAYSGSRQVTVDHSKPVDEYEFFDRCITDEHRQLIDKDWRNLYIGQYIGAPSAVIYRKCDLKFDESLQWLIDADFYMGLLQGGGKAACSKEPLVSIGVSSDQLTNSCATDKDINIREYKHLFNKFDLGKEQAYRHVLTDVCVRFKGKLSDIADCGITAEEYRPVLKAYRKELAEFYRGLILRKLGLKH